MTNSEKLNELTKIWREKMSVYSAYAKELKGVIARGDTLTKQQIKNQDTKMSDLQTSLNEYSALLVFITKNGYSYNEEYVENLI